MRSSMVTRLKFISKSLLWSLLLYVTAMLFINWDEQAFGFHKKGSVNVAVMSSMQNVPHPLSSVVISTPQKISGIEALSNMWTAIKTGIGEINKAAGFLKEK